MASFLGILTTVRNVSLQFLKNSSATLTSLRVTLYCSTLLYSHVVTLIYLMYTRGPMSSRLFSFPLFMLGFTCRRSTQWRNAASYTISIVTPSTFNLCAFLSCLRLLVHSLLLIQLNCAGNSRNRLDIDPWVYLIST